MAKQRDDSGHKDECCGRCFHFRCSGFTGEEHPDEILLVQDELKDSDS